jgi:hypothetical protein
MNCHPSPPCSPVGHEVHPVLLTLVSKWKAHDMKVGRFWLPIMSRFAPLAKSTL